MNSISNIFVKANHMPKEIIYVILKNIKFLHLINLMKISKFYYNLVCNFIAVVPRNIRYIPFYDITNFANLQEIKCSNFSVPNSYDVDLSKIIYLKLCSDKHSLVNLSESFYNLKSLKKLIIYSTSITYFKELDQSNKYEIRKHSLINLNKFKINEIPHLKKLYLCNLTNISSVYSYINLVKIVIRGNRYNHFIDLSLLSKLKHLQICASITPFLCSLGNLTSLEYLYSDAMAMDFNNSNTNNLISLHL